MTDGEIKAAARTDPDSPLLGDEQLHGARLHVLSCAQRTRIDEDASPHADDALHVGKAD